METGDKQLNNGGSKCLSRICKICGKEGTMGSIKNHIEAHHITGVSHMCDICGQTSRSRPALAKHKTLNHKKHQLYMFLFIHSPDPLLQSTKHSTIRNINCICFYLFILQTRSCKAQ